MPGFPTDRCLNDLLRHQSGTRGIRFAIPRSGKHLSAAAGRQMQGTPASIVLGVHIRACLQEHRDHLRRSDCCGPMQRSLARPVEYIRGGSRAEKARNALGPAYRGRVQQRLPGIVLGVEASPCGEVHGDVPNRRRHRCHMQRGIAHVAPAWMPTPASSRAAIFASRRAVSLSADSLSDQ